MRMLAWIALIVGCLPIPAMAAPFCLAIPGLAPQCIYEDGNACSTDAFRQNGSCVPNPALGAMPVSRVGDFCMITAEGVVQCGYADGISCARDAKMQRGICTKSHGTIPQQVPDPYVPNAGR